jgi:HEAT repeat protein
MAVTDAFTDGEKEVRAAAIKVTEARKDVGAVDTLLALLQKGDEATVATLAAIGNADVARRVAELVGEAPDPLVAETLGKLALRTDLGNEMVYVEIIRAIGKIPGDEAVVALAAYIAAQGEKSFRQSKREAQMLYEQRLGGGQ